MELLSLRTFQAVVDEGGVLSASRKLNTVQSNITTRIKKLEQELGAELFYRKGRGLELAPSGRVLLEYSRQLLQLESRAGAAVRQVGEHSGELRIGTMETFAALRLPPALKTLRQTHPGLELRVETNTSSVLIERVLNHKLDCAFVGGLIDHPELDAVEVLQEELVLVRSKQHADSQSALILFREGCAYRDRALMWQRECGQQISEVMELGTLDGILGCVAVGLGCTLVPRGIINQSRYQQDLSVESLPAHLSLIPTVLVQHRHATPLKAVTSLITAVASQKNNYS
tara:strand:+ start:2497 stop:3354 length:858 start_codon:yes stop_codon:yes gene_type:complete